ncbi:acyclic terpene utilization AtuA family protein [Gordonia humi]|uniref:Acyclic terpene utilisation N-terminal domain-containing protein n=1 Tax=Gordonia humi TaxID=686429 RepID=A0A840F6I4_9ACTN|nr:hypothetical protein [Gordonia humi]
MSVLVPTGMLGAGFPADTISRGITLGVDVIAVDGGSTDSGPYYLGASKPKTTRAAVLRDLREILTGAARADIAVIVGSCGTSGTDNGVEWLYDITRQVIEEEELTGRRVARIYSEQGKDLIKQRLHDGQIHPLAPAAEITEETVDGCAHIVGLMGHEPIAEALDGGANIVLAGRATDCAVIAAVPLMRGKPFGPTWHASKIAECGSLCTTGNGIGGVVVHIGEEGFVVEPVDTDLMCTPQTVAAHMLYENTDPHRLREPAGTLDTSRAEYSALDDRRVFVQGSQFEFQSPTVKLEGSGVVGAQTLSIVGLRDPDLLARIDEWIDSLEKYLHSRIPEVLGLAEEEYDIQMRPYGWNAVLGKSDPSGDPPREVGLVFCATAQDQETATAVAKLANPRLLHHPLPGADSLPSWSFMSSPAELERGALYSFMLNHVVEVSSPTELFPIKYTEEL